MSNRNNNIFNKYKKTHKDFCTKYVLEGPLSVYTVNTIMYFMNFENGILDYIQDIDLEYKDPECIKVKRMNDAKLEIVRNNIEGYRENNKKIIKLSEATINKEQSEIIEHTEFLLDTIANGSKSEAKNAYELLESIIINGKTDDDTKSLTYGQKQVLKLIDLEVARDLYNYRYEQNPKQKYLQNNNLM